MRKALGSLRLWVRVRVTLETVSAKGEGRGLGLTLIGLALIRLTLIGLTLIGLTLIRLTLIGSEDSGWTLGSGVCFTFEVIVNFRIFQIHRTAENGCASWACSSVDQQVGKEKNFGLLVGSSTYLTK